MTTALIVTVSLVLMAAVGFVAGRISGRRQSASHRRFLERELAQQESCIASLKQNADAVAAGAAQSREDADGEPRVAQLRARLAQAEQLAERHQDTAKSLERELNELRQAAAAAEPTGLIEAERIEALERDAEASRAQIETLEAALHERDTTVASLRATLDEIDANPPAALAGLDDHDARTLLAERDAELERLREDNAGLTARMQERLRKADHEAERVKRVAEARRLELADLNREITVLREKLRAGDDGVETTREQRQQLGLQLQESRVAEESLRQALTTRQEALARARDELTELESRYGKQISERDARIRELETTQADEADVTRRYREQSERLQVVVDELSTRIKEYHVAAEARDETIRGREEALEKLRQEIDELEHRYAAQLQATELEIEHLRGELATAGEARGAATAAAAAARADGKSLREQLDQEHGARAQSEDREKLLQVRVGDLQAQLAGRAQELDKARVANQEIEDNYGEQIAERDRRVAELQDRLTAADSSAVAAHGAARTAAERTEQLREELAGRDQTLGETLEQVAELTGRIGELEQRLEAAHAAATEERAGLEASIERMRDAERQARTESSDLRSELESSRQSEERQALALADAKESAARRQRERDFEISRLTQLLETREEELRDATERAEQAETAVTQASIRVGDEQITVGELQGQLLARDTDIEVLRSDVERNQLAVEVLEADLAERAASHERSMRERRLETERLQGLLEARTEELQQATARLDQVSADLSRTLERLHRRDIRIDGQEAELSRFREQRDRLQREVHEREQQLRQLRALIRSEPQNGDDLEQIHGIGPKVKRLLNEAGVICFRQIAKWQAGDVEWLLQRVPELAGRIRRDAWIEEAREAHLAQYGEEID